MTQGDRSGFKRIPRAEQDFYYRHSERVLAAFERAEIGFFTYAALSFLIDKIGASRTDETSFTLAGLADALDWPQEEEHLRRVLHDLRDGEWIDFDDPRPGPRPVWTFRLRRAAIDGDGESPPESPPSLLQKGPLPEETNSTELESEQPSNPHGESDPAAPNLHREEVPREETSREEMSRAEKTFSEEEGDRFFDEGTQAEKKGSDSSSILVTSSSTSSTFSTSGEGTRTEPEREPLEKTKRLLEVLHKTASVNCIPVPGDDDLGTHLRGAYRAGHITHSEYRDRVALNGWIMRAAPPLGEEATLAEIQQVFVDDGQGRWKDT